MAAFQTGRRPLSERSKEQHMRANLHRLLVAVALIAPAPSAFADVITDWNEKAVAFVTRKMAPAAGQRVVTIMHVAMFDAVNSIDRRYRPYLVQLPAAASTSKEAAAAAAAGTVLASLHPQAEGELRAPWRPILPPFPTAMRKRRESSSARQSRRKSSRRAPTTARTRRIPIGQRPSRASTLRRRSRSRRLGPT